jgi:hypothetical protein
MKIVIPETREQLEKRVVGLARGYAETHDKKAKLEGL